MSPKVVVLGGGVGGVTAALQLSQPGWQQHYDSITLHQMGWRLGGKGASGRGENDRIEEHGLHVWFGFYENAFRLLNECHAELDDIAASGAPGTERWPLVFDDVETSFTPTDVIGLTDHDGCSWSPWLADFFEPSDDRPWLERPAHASHPSEWSVPYYFARSIHLAATFARSVQSVDQPLVMSAGPAPVSTVDVLGDVADLAGMFVGIAGADAGAALTLASEGAELIAHEAAEQPLVRQGLSVVLALCDHALDLLRIQFDHEIRAHPEIRRSWYLIDIFVAVARGLVDDEVIVDDDLQRIDDEDFRDWLRRHGASADSIDCALVRSIVYDLAFAFEGGDPNRPRCGAGTALRGVFRMFFTYRGSLMFKMNSGMGDVIFAPIYELLIKRGVKVEFFDRIEKVEISGGSVTAIVVDRQAVVAPTVTPRDYLGGSTMSVTGTAATWPASPTTVLTGATVAAPPTKLTKAGGSVYESWYVGRGVRTGTRTLSVGTDFDYVVYALPISTVAQCAPDLLALPEWNQAVTSVRTVPTQAMQLWLTKPASELGPWPDGVVVGGYVEPYDTWADMSQLHGQEAVPGAATVAYFCSALWDADPPQRGATAAAWLAEQKALVVAQGRRFLERDIGALWPDASHPIDGSLDWNVLVAPPGVHGEDRLDHQYLRANVEPSERYVLSVPGSSRHRIRPDATGVDNLFAAGDWTDNVINAGCVEAAVISGMRAANGVHQAAGWPEAVVEIIGDQHP